MAVCLMRRMGLSLVAKGLPTMTLARVPQMRARSPPNARIACAANGHAARGCQHSCVLTGLGCLPAMLSKDMAEQALPLPLHAGGAFE